MNLSAKQKEIVESKYDKIVVDSAAAAGKTACIAERVHYLIGNGMAPEDIVVLTFTVAAAEEMRQRIGDYKGLFIGTVHALAYKWMCEAGYSSIANAYVNDESFDRFFEFLQEHPSCIKTIPYLIIDEAQDTDSNMWAIFFEYMDLQKFFIVGDHRQVIYDGFRAVNPTMLMNISRMEDVYTYRLNENYRNGYTILDFAKSIINQNGGQYIDDSIAMRDTPGLVEKDTYSNYVIEDIISLENSEHYGDWFILASTNKEVSDIMGILSNMGVPNQKLTRGGKTKKQLDEMMGANKVTVGTFHSSKGLEKKNVIVCGAATSSGRSRRIAYVAATRAIDRLVWLTKRKTRYWR